MTQRLLLLLAVCLLGTAGLFAHRALFEATPLAIAAWRLGLAALFFLGWSGLQRTAAPVSWGEGRSAGRLILAGMCLAAHFVAWYASLQYTTIARGTLLVCTTPLWTTLGSLVLHQRRISPWYWLALTLAGFGLWLVTQTGARIPTHAVLLGDCLAVLGGMLFATYLLAVEGLHSRISPRAQVTVAYTVAAVILWTLLISRGGVTLHYSSGVWAALLGMTLGPQILGHTLFNASLRHFPASTVSFSILLEPIVASILAWIIFHQAISPVQLLGGIFVLVGLTVVIAQQTPTEVIVDEPVG